MNVPQVAALGCLLLAMQSCSAEDVGYVVRAAYEEARILARRQSIDAVLADADTDAETRAKLELTTQSRAFAESRLGLDVGGSYRSLAAVDQDQVVHVVSAAHRNRLEAVTWWFPIAGSVPYRGYFQRDAAVAFAESLEDEGYDTYVRRAVAFSTLGYFDDPLLSHLLRHRDEVLAETIIHELLHSTIYLPGHTAFNESFANFVGHRGAIAFFEERGAHDEAARARDRWADTLQFGEFLAGVLADLRSAYAREVTEDERAGLFDAARAGFHARTWRTTEYDRFASEPLNNAVLLARHVYFDRLELFEEVYQRFAGDLPATIAWIAQAARAGDEPFDGVQSALAAAH